MSAATLPLSPTADDLMHLESDHNRRFNKHLLDASNDIRQRIIIERAVVRKACSDMIRDGLELRVYDGEDWATVWTDNLDAIMEAIQSVDEEHIHAREVSNKARRGNIFLVYGNGGWDVIADHSVNLEVVLLGANKLADELGELAHA